MKANTFLIAAIVLALACIIFCPAADASLPEATYELIQKDSYILIEPTVDANRGDIYFVGTPATTTELVCASAAANGYTLRSVRIADAKGNWVINTCK